RPAAREDRITRAQRLAVVRIAPHVEAMAVGAEDRAVRLSDAAGLAARICAVLARAVVRDAPGLAPQLGQSPKRLVRSIRRPRQQRDDRHPKDDTRGPPQNASSNPHDPHLLSPSRPLTSHRARGDPTYAPRRRLRPFSSTVPPPATGGHYHLRPVLPRKRR